jgi:penicillin-binding protein 2
MFEDLKTRFVILMTLYLAAFVFIILQLVNLQIVQGEGFDKDSQRRLLRTIQVRAPRGNIYDRNFLPLAQNRMTYSVLVSRTSATAEDLNKMIYHLINIFESHEEPYFENISNYLTFDPIDYGPYIKNSPEAIERWKREIVLKSKDVEGLETPEDVYHYLKTTRFRISDEYTLEDAYKIMGIRYRFFMSGYTAVNPIVIADDVSEMVVAQIEERHFEFPGVFTQVSPMRQYIDAKDSAHVMGYIGKLTKDEYDRKANEGYRMDDFIGKVGVENYAEDLLRGIDGTKQVEVDTNGRLTAEVGGETVVPGNDLILTIDHNLQKVAMESLQRNIQKIREGYDGRSNFGDAFAGSAVVLDVHSGEVLALASFPSFDPDVFVSSLEDRESQNLRVEYLTDTKAPMFNRALRGTYRPASTFKPITAIAALEEGRITPTQMIYDSGYFTVTNLTFTDFRVRRGNPPLGNISLTRALGVSSNMYFYEIGVSTGIDNISKWASYFGLGARTGIDIPGEVSGVLGNREYKNTVQKESWYPADTAQTSIGEFYNSFTPLQIANYVSSIANGGKLYKPHVIKKVLSAEGDTVKVAERTYEQIPVKKETLDAIKNGMVYATSVWDGTAAYAFSGFPIKVAAKTGTSETVDVSGKISSNSVFIGFAPAENPEIALAVVIERGVWGSNSAPVARDIFTQYFGINKPPILEKPAYPEGVRLTF